VLRAFFSSVTVFLFVPPYGGFFALKKALTSAGVSRQRALQNTRLHISLFRIKSAAKVTSTKIRAAEVKNSGGLIWPGLCWLSVSDEDINLLPDGALSRWQKAERRYFADESL